MGTGHESVEKQRGAGGVIPGERARRVGQRKGEIDPVKSSKVDLLRGQRGRRPVWVVGHYESASGGERGRRERTGHVQQRGGTREKPKEDQGRHRNNKRIHIKRSPEDVGTSQREKREEEKLNSFPIGPLTAPFLLLDPRLCDVVIPRAFANSPLPGACLRGAHLRRNRNRSKNCV